MNEPDSGFLSPERRPELVEQANAELRGRLLSGLFPYPAMIAVLAATTAAFHEHPHLMFSAVALLSGGLMLRAGLLIWWKSRFGLSPAGWRYLTGLSVVIVSGTCGYVHAALLVLYGLDSWAFAVSVFWIAGLATGGAFSFVPDRSLVWTHLMLLEGPVLTASLRMGGIRAYLFAATVLVFVLYLASQSGRLHREYWKGLADRASEADRRRELESLTEAKSRLLANMSHEIRTPMHGIMGLVQLLQAKDCPAEKRDYYLDTLYGSTKGLLHVLNDVLDFSKIDAGKLQLETATFEIRQLVEEIRQILVAQAESKSLRWQCSVRANVPDVLRGDPVRLRQVLLNLAANAIKFTEKGCVSVDVQAGVPPFEGDAELLFSVKDTGIGIPLEQQGLIFQAFTQADKSITRRFGGTGLGLAISSQLVQLMGGRIRVQSEPGHGSCFSFACRFGVSDDLPPAETPPYVPASRYRILLAEDNLVNQTVAIHLLEKQGHSVRLATTGLEAVDLAAAEGFDVILMDDQMPELSGLEATRAIRARGSTVPILGLSASATTADRGRFLAAGMDACLAKPFLANDLYAAIDALASHHPAGCKS